MRKIDNRSVESSRKTEGLDEKYLQDEDDEGKCLLYFTLISTHHLLETFSLSTRNLALMRAVLVLREMEQ